MAVRALNRSVALLAAGFAVLAAVLLTTLAVADGAERNDKDVAHTLDVQNRLTGLMSAVQDAETGQRGYLLTGDRAYLEPYDQAAARIDSQLAQLAVLISDNPVQVQAMGALKPKIGGRLDLIRDSIALRAAGAMTPQLITLRAGRGKVMMDAIRADIARMRAEEDRLLILRRAQAAKANRWLRLALGGGFVGVVVLSALAVRDSRARVAEVAAARDDLSDKVRQLRAAGEDRDRAEAQIRQMQKMESLGQLTGGIAHDFNNMLAVIVGSLDMAKRRLAAEPAEASGYIDSALEGAQRAASLTARLLAFARNQPLSPTVLDVNRLVGGMSEMLRRTLGDGVRIETVLAGGLWRIHADGPQLESALLNLCVNGRDAMVDGGRLTIETSNAFLDDAYAGAHADVHPGQYVLIGVTDTGVGMDAAVAERAFDPFYTTKGVGKGTGLGLSQVYGFVKQSGGHAKIYSEPGVGTTVKVYLPRHLDGGDLGPPSSSPPPLRAPVGGRERILLVEDDEQVRRTHVDALNELGYEVLQASGGAEALALLRQQPDVGLLFTDVVMPGMNGRALADAATALRPGLKVLFTTGYTQNSVVHNGVLEPGVAFLPKPFGLDQLAAKVRQTLDS